MDLMQGNIPMCFLTSKIPLCIYKPFQIEFCQFNNNLIYSLIRIFIIHLINSVFHSYLLDNNSTAHDAILVQPCLQGSFHFLI